MNCKDPLTKLEKIKQQFCEYNWNVFYSDSKKNIYASILDFQIGRLKETNL